MSNNSDVKVKPIEWKEVRDDAFAGGVVAYGSTLLGVYRAWGSGLWWSPGMEHGKHNGTLDTAKAAATAHYEAAILSTLETL